MIRRRKGPPDGGLDPILEASLDAVIAVDDRGRVTGWNTAAETIFGYPRERALGARLTELIVPPAYRGRHEAGFAQAARTGEGPLLNRRIEVPALRADGSEIPIELCLAPLKRGTRWSFCAFVRDLSARDADRAALRQSETRFAQVMANLPGMVYVFALAPDGAMSFRYVSPGCQAIFGCPPEAFLSGEMELRVPQDARETFLAGIRESAQTLAPWRWSGTMVHSEGHELWTEAASHPEREPDGTIVWHGLLTDATEHHRTIAANDEARLFLRAIFDQIPDILFIKDGEDLRYSMFNRAGERFLGMKEGEAAGRNDHDIFGPIEGTRIAHEDDDTIRRGTMAENERCHRNAQGELVHLHTRKVPLYDEARGRSYLLGIVQDVSESRRLEEHLRHANESLEETVFVRTAELRATQEEILTRLGRAAAYRDGETGCHIQRMARTCEAIARELGLPESDCALILRAAPMHDIGKIAIPDGILLKPGRLNDEEVAVMKTHAEVGAQMLSGGSSDLLVVAESIARTHHERWDGAGYPHGLAGETIPLAGRIAAVADVFDALTSERPYKRAWSDADALEEIGRGAGTQFDPLVVAAFRQVLAGCGDALPAAA